MILETLQCQFTEEAKNHISTNPPPPTFLTNGDKKLLVFLTHSLDKEESARVFNITYDI